MVGVGSGAVGSELVGVNEGVGAIGLGDEQAEASKDNISAIRIVRGIIFLYLLKPPSSAAGTPPGASLLN